MRLRSAGLIASAQQSMSLKRGAGEPADDGVLGALGDLVDGGEIAVGGDRKSGLDDVDAHVVEQFGDFELFLMRHGGAGALLAVAQGGVENDDTVLLGRRASAFGLTGWTGRGHGLSPFRSRLPLRFRGVGRSWVPLLRSTPECPGANAQPALRGR